MTEDLRATDGVPVAIEDDAGYWRKMYEERVTLEDEGFAALLADRDRQRDRAERLSAELQTLVDVFLNAPFLRAERLLYDLSREFASDDQ